MKNKRLFLVGELTYELLANFAEKFVEADSKDGMICVSISSGGGDMDVGISIYEMLRASRNPIATEAIGHVGSMAVLVLNAGDYRVASPGTTILIHDAEVSINSTLARAKPILNDVVRGYKWYCDEIAKRSGIDPVKLYQFANQETYFTAQEALQLGLIDAIRPYRPFIKAGKKKRK